MSFRINSSANPMDRYNVKINENAKLLNQSIQRLSTGVKVNSSADDVSGLEIANSLRIQRYTYSQGIRNSNEGIAITQIADSGVKGQIEILDMIKTKAIQASQDGQSSDTKITIQKDITKLIKALDLISDSTMYNSHKLLSGNYQNKKFHYGSPIDQTIDLSIASTRSDKIGNTRFETGTLITSASINQEVSLKFMKYDGLHDLKLKSAKIGTSVGEGIGNLSNIINQASNTTGIKASWRVLESASSSIEAGTINNLNINGIEIGTLTDIKNSDSDGKLTKAINELTNETGIKAFVKDGKLNLKSVDGRGIQISGSGLNSIAKLRDDVVYNFGRLSLTKFNSNDISISGTNSSLAGFDNNSESQISLTLSDMKFDITSTMGDAIGAYANSNQINGNLGSGVTNFNGAMALIDVSDSALKELSQIRSEIGATHNQFNSMINTLSVTTVNMASVESQIRDIDFGAESLTFQRRKLLAQSGSFVVNQANGLNNLEAVISKLFQ